MIINDKIKSLRINFLLWFYEINYLLLISVIYQIHIYMNLIFYMKEWC